MFFYTYRNIKYINNEALLSLMFYSARLAEQREAG